ncbi:hypothetical protein ACQ4LE_004722 [Meloidogyne hapla]
MDGRNENRRRERQNVREEHNADEEFGREYPILSNHQTPTFEQLATIFEILISRNQRQDARNNQNNQTPQQLGKENIPPSK